MTAFDIEEFFGSQIGSEACFGYDIVAESESHAGGYGRIAAVSNVGERPSVYEYRIMFGRLHQIRFYRIA